MAKDLWSLRPPQTSKLQSTNWTVKISKEPAFAAWLIPKTRFPATTATALAPLHHFVGAAVAVVIHHLTATTAVVHLHPVATALAAMITVVAPRPVTITTLVTAATVLRLPLAQLAHLLMILIPHPLVAAIAMIPTLRRPVVDMRIPMWPTDMIDLELDRLQGLMADTMSVPRHRDTEISNAFPYRTPR